MEELEAASVTRGKKTTVPKPKIEAASEHGSASLLPVRISS